MKQKNPKKLTFEKLTISDLGNLDVTMSPQTSLIIPCASKGQPSDVVGFCCDNPTGEYLALEAIVDFA